MHKLVGIILALAALYATPALAQEVVAGRVGGTVTGRVQVLNVDNNGGMVATGNSFCHIATATITACKASAGVLHTVTVNNLGTVASVTTIYNNTAGSGAVIAVINTLAGQTSYIYDVAFTVGLTVVTTGTVAPDITVSYR